MVGTWSFFVVLQLVMTPGVGSLDESQHVMSGGLRAKELVWDTRMDPDRYRQAVRVATSTALAPDLRRAPTLSRWESIGPLYMDWLGDSRHGAGRVRDIQFWNQDGVGPLPVVGASSGGLYRLFIAGVFPLWIPLGENLDCPSVGGFAVHPSNPDVMIVGTGDHNRYGGCGLFRTPDAGASWKPLDTGSTPDWVKKVLYADATGMEVWAAGETGILKSTDGGETWGVELAGEAHDIVQHPSQPQTFYAARKSTGISKTEDGGQRWDPMNTGLPPSSKRDVVLLAIAESSPNELWTVVYDEDEGLLGAYKSVDGGITWIWKGPMRGTDIDTPQDAVDPVMQGFHALSIAVSPVDPDLVYVGASRVVRTTTGANDATEWARVSFGHADQTRLVFDPGNENTIWSANDGGIYSQDVNTLATQSQNIWGLPIAQAYSLDLPDTDIQKVISGTQDNGVVIRKRGNTSVWDKAVDGDGTDVAFANGDAQRIYAANGVPFSRRTSSDTGNTLVRIDQQLSVGWAPTMQVDKAISSGSVVVTHDAGHATAGGTGRAWYSIDFGASWKSFAAPWGAGPSIRRVRMNWSGDYAIYVYFWNDSRVFVGTGGNLAAINFEERSIPGVSRLLAIQPDRYDTKVAYAMEESPGKRVWRTDDLGETWDDISGNLVSNVQVFSVVSHPGSSKHLFAGTQLGLFRSGNGGATWTRFMEGLPKTTHIYDMKMVSDEKADYLYIATFGHGHWRRAVDGELAPLLFEHGFESPGLLGWDVVVGD